MYMYMYLQTYYITYSVIIPSKLYGHFPCKRSNNMPDTDSISYKEVQLHKLRNTNVNVITGPSNQKYM